MLKNNIAIAGVTGAVGKEILKVLEKRNFPFKSINFYASKDSVGVDIKFKGKNYKVKELCEDSFDNIDIIFFATSNKISEKFSPIASKKGALVIDNSSAFRMDENVPLVIPQINLEDIKLNNGIISNPNCSTIILLMGIYPIFRIANIIRIICSTYQSVSGSGIGAIDELRNQSIDYLTGRKLESNIFPYPIAFNLFSHDSFVGEDGYNIEEHKIINETRKILKKDIKITATCVRVPSFRVHCESVNLELDRFIKIDDVKKAIDDFPGTVIVDRPEDNYFPMPINASGCDDVLVGRIRRDYSHANGFSLFIAGDQLLKGAALNAVEIAESVLTL